MKDQHFGGLTLRTWFPIICATIARTKEDKAMDTEFNDQFYEGDSF
jgi:hypothetical protein